MNMLPVVDAMQVRKAIDVVKGACIPFRTNFFLSDEALLQAAAQGRVLLCQAPRVVLIIVREPDFDRVYYACGGDLDALPAALDAVEPAASGNLVSDVLGSQDATQEVVPLFERAGFRVYASFQRMQRLPNGPPPAEAADPLVGLATLADAPAVLEMISGHFDNYAEHIPDLLEIEQAAKRGTILLSKSDGRIAAVLYYDRQGVSTTLRYWLALPDFRGQGHADRLMRAYSQACADSKRFLLWVECRNRRALGLYLHYGYRSVPTIDVILRKGRHDG